MLVFTVALARIECKTIAKIPVCDANALYGIVRRSNITLCLQAQRTTCANDET